MSPVVLEEPASKAGIEKRLFHVGFGWYQLMAILVSFATVVGIGWTDTFAHSLLTEDGDKIFCIVMMKLSCMLGCVFSSFVKTGKRYVVVAGYVIGGGGALSAAHAMSSVSFVSHEIIAAWLSVAQFGFGAGMCAGLSIVWESSPTSWRFFALSSFAVCASVAGAVLRNFGGSWSDLVTMSSVSLLCSVVSVLVLKESPFGFSFQSIIDCRRLNSVLDSIERINRIGINIRRSNDPMEEVRVHFVPATVVGPKFPALSVLSCQFGETVLAGFAFGLTSAFLRSTEPCNSWLTEVCGGVLILVVAGMMTGIEKRSRLLPEYGPWALTALILLQIRLMGHLRIWIGGISWAVAFGYQLVQLERVMRGGGYEMLGYSLGVSKIVECVLDPFFSILFTTQVASLVAFSVLFALLGCVMRIGNENDESDSHLVSQQPILREDCLLLEKGHDDSTGGSRLFAVSHW